MSESQRIVARLADWEEDEALLRRIRTAVFVDEQQVPPELEWDGADPQCTHVLAGPAMGEAVATGRLTAQGKIGRLAVLKPFRGLGYGRALMERLIDAAVAAGTPALYLHAQSHALGFYEGFGFVAEGPEFDEAGIAHRLMRRRLDGGPTARIRDLASAADYADALVELCQTAGRSLLILTGRLEPAVFDAPAVVSALQSFCTAHRSASVRVLVGAADGARHAGRFVDLARRLTSTIAVRRLAGEQDDPGEAFCIADGRAIALRRQAGAWAGRLHADAPRLASPRRALFDELWEHSEAEPEVRRLYL